jgi:predicted Abi (CAAX) family protease
LVGRRVHGALTSILIWPSGRDWLRCVVLGLVAGGSILGIGFGTGLLAWTWSDGNLLGLFLRVLIMPALVEELLFRGLLTASRGDEPRVTRAIGPGLVAFVLWHVGAGLLLRGAAFFLRADFLACAYVLGLACALMRWQSGSIWPGVAFHAAAVWVWQAFLGGVGVDDLP